MVVNHSRHRIRRLNAMTRTLRSGVAFTLECADSVGSNSPGEQNSQENYRACGSWCHFPTVPYRPRETQTRLTVSTH